MKYLPAIILAFALLSPVFGAAPSFVRAGQTYTVIHLSEKHVVVTLKEDQGNGWWSAQLAGTSDTVFVNLGDATMIVPGSYGAGSSLTADAVKKSILNNLRQLAAAADQYFLENGVTQVAAKELIGPSKYVKELKSLDGEDYVSLVIQQGRAIHVKTRSGLDVQYRP